MGSRASTLLLHHVAQVTREGPQADVVVVGAAAVAGRAGVGQHDVDLAVALLDEVEQAIERALGKDRVGAADLEADILLRDADRVLRGAEDEIARQLALVGEVGGDAGAQPPHGEDRHATGGRARRDGQRERAGTGAGRHALATGEARELHRRLLVEIGADELPQPVGEARGAGRGGAAHQHRQVVHRIVDEIVLGPQIVTADQRLATVDGDELGVRPGEALAILEDGAGTHGRDIDGEARARNVAQVRRQRRQQRRRVDVVGRVLADDKPDRDRPAARRQLVEAGPQRAEEARVGPGLQCRDVDRAPGARDQVVHRQQQGVGVAEADLAPGAARGGPPRSCRRCRRWGSRRRCCRPAADVALAILAVERIERQIGGAMAPARRALHHPVLGQAVAAAQIVGDAGKLSVGVALGDFASHLLEQRHGRGLVRRPDVALANQCRDRDSAGKRTVVAFTLAIERGAVGQFAAGNESAEQHEMGEPAGPARKGHGHGQRLNPLSNCSEV